MQELIISIFHDFELCTFRDIKDWINALDVVHKANETLIVNWKEYLIDHFKVWIDHVNVEIEDFKIIDSFKIISCKSKFLSL